MKGISDEINRFLHLDVAIVTPPLNNNSYPRRCREVWVLRMEEEEKGRMVISYLSSLIKGKMVILGEI